MRKPSTRSMEKLLRTPDYGKARKGRITEQLFFYFLPPPSPEIKQELERLSNDPHVLQSMTNGKRLNEALSVAMAAHEISDLDSARADPVNTAFTAKRRSLNLSVPTGRQSKTESTFDDKGNDAST